MPKEKPQTTTTSKPQPRRMSDVSKARADKTSDMPEFIKAEELQGIRPFTIFGGRTDRGRYGERVSFDVAYKEGDTVTKKILTLSANDERLDLLLEVKRSKGVINCRIVRLILGGGQTYWKIIDNDEPVPEDVRVDERQIDDQDIPFA